MSNQQSLEDLQHIRKMMERSERFISLSGLSGIAAGICALGGAYFAHNSLLQWNNTDYIPGNVHPEYYLNELRHLLMIAAITFIAAFISSFIFTYLHSKKKNIPIWGGATLRLLWNTTIPLLAGAIFLFKMLGLGMVGLIAPGCLIFYGLALVNASKYTLGEIRYLGYAEIILGVINLWNLGYGLRFWAIGFGLLHIIYGAIMWWKNEKAA
ncbi:hypothetical protein [Ferruginibacter albus]|uniref:hypothetical protein n=1 Tax=Ferruginibacter albus TaxID=2875540 RepID=UPI001CC73EFA|nr:hypothetical protein [Ferruginibacter albus]UAY51680.1 hypothetical protein K9M53_13925 [Ferruginibacter albus]